VWSLNFAKNSIAQIALNTITTEIFLSLALILISMPTILRVKGYRFFFYINDHSPAHIHVEKGEGTAKYGLEPIELIKSKRFKAGEISEIRMLIYKNIELFKTKWDAYINNK
jgi:hypothetical protein